MYYSASGLEYVFVEAYKLNFSGIKEYPLLIRVLLSVTDDINNRIIGTTAQNDKKIITAWPMN